MIRFQRAGFRSAFSLLAAIWVAGPLFCQPMEVMVCTVSHSDPGAGDKLRLLKEMGVTSIQTYVDWSKVEKERRVMDWSEYDADVALFKQHGLKWVPFIIAGPWYVTPEFVRRDPEIVMYRCLEHGRESAIPSLWSPRLRQYVREYLQKFADHYLPQGVLESINLGITGDYGEAIYSVIGNWPGEYHSHGGFWCGDPLAVADFRRVMKGLYGGDIAALNRGWKTRYDAFDDIRPFLPSEAPSPRARLEFLRWYRDSMTRYAGFWLAEAREVFPDVEIYLCTGGDMAPEHGSDFSAQAKVAARYGAGIRITNEASSFSQNFAMTRLVGSACRHYGAYFGHEPASTVTPVGMLGRLFNAAASGAHQLFLYNAPELVSEHQGKVVPGEGGFLYLRFKDWQRTEVPVVDVGLLYPTSSDTHRYRDYGTFRDLAAEVRRWLDYDLLDERLIQENALHAKKILIMAGADLLEAATLEKIAAWVSEGGLLFVLDSRPLDWDGEKKFIDDLLGFVPETEEIRGITGLAVDQPERLPSIASLPSVFVSRAFSQLSDAIEPLLSMRYAPKGRIAWRQRVGAGLVYAYFGPMDLRQKEESWTVAHNLPFRFVKDGIEDCVRQGFLEKTPVSLNPGVADLYLVETRDDLLVLNMGDEDKRVETKGGLIEISGRSIKRVKKVP